MPAPGFEPVTLKDADIEQINRLRGKLPVAKAAVVRATIAHARDCKHFKLEVPA